MGFDLLGTKKVRVIAGDLPAGDYKFEYGSLMNLDYPTEKSRNISLDHNTKSITLQSESEAKNWLIAAGFGAVGAIFGPVGAIIGLTLGGHHKVCAAIVETKDGKKFMIATNMGVIEQMRAYALVGTTAPEKETDK